MIFRSTTQVTRFKIQAQQRSVGYCAINCNAFEINTGKGRVHPMMFPLKVYMYRRRTWAEIFDMNLSADTGYIEIKLFTALDSDKRPL